MMHHMMTEGMMLTVL